jgi:hypothetical protein
MIMKKRGLLKYWASQTFWCLPIFLLRCHIFVQFLALWHFAIEYVWLCHIQMPVLGGPPCSRHTPTTIWSRVHLYISNHTVQWSTHSIAPSRLIGIFVFFCFKFIQISNMETSWYHFWPHMEAIICPYWQKQDQYYEIHQKNTTYLPFLWTS